MSLVKLSGHAAELPTAWSSQILARLGDVNFKVLRMDAQTYANETHDFSEVLLVIDGQMNLQVGEQLIQVRAGEAYIMPAHTTHAVAAGSFGTLVIIDQ